MSDVRRPAPLWQQVQADLRARLAAGEFTDAFPGEHALTAHYGVSRHTVREALRALRADGLVTAARGQAPRLGQPARWSQRMGTLASLFASVEDGGGEQVSHVRRLEVQADGTVAARLGLEESTPLLHLERLRLADCEPLALDRAWLPADLAAPLLDVDFTHTSLYAELAAHCGVHLTESTEHVRAVVATTPSGGCSGSARARPCWPSSAARAQAGARWSGVGPSCAVTGSPSPPASATRRSPHSRGSWSVRGDGRPHPRARARHRGEPRRARRRRLDPHRPRAGLRPRPERAGGDDGQPGDRRGHLGARRGRSRALRTGPVGRRGDLRRRRRGRVACWGRTSTVRSARTCCWSASPSSCWWPPPRCWPRPMVRTGDSDQADDEAASRAAPAVAAGRPPRALRRRRPRRRGRVRTARQGGARGAAWWAS